MEKKFFLFKILILYTFLSSMCVGAITNYFNEGKKLYDNNKFEQSKIFFERDITFNPRSEKSYLYLAKIYKNKDNREEEEVNLNNVLLINPQNEEAVYMLILIRIEQSDYKEAKKLIERFNLVCNLFCSKKSEIQDKFDKLIPQDAKNNN